MVDAEAPKGLAPRSENGTAKQSRLTGLLIG